MTTKITTIPMFNGWSSDVAAFDLSLSNSRRCSDNDIVYTVIISITSLAIDLWAPIVMDVEEIV